MCYKDQGLLLEEYQSLVHTSHSLSHSYNVSDRTYIYTMIYEMDPVGDKIKKKKCCQNEHSYQIKKGIILDKKNKE